MGSQRVGHEWATDLIWSDASRHVGSQFPAQESNPHTLHWKRSVLTTGPPGKSLGFLLYALGYKLIWLYLCSCSNCPCFSYWELFQVSPHPTPSWWGFSLSAFLPSVTTRGCPSSCVFPLPVLESTNSPRSPGNFYWRTVLGIKIWALGVLVATEMLLLGWQSMKCSPRPNFKIFFHICRKPEIVTKNNFVCFTLILFSAWTIWK